MIFDPLVESFLRSVSPIVISVSWLGCGARSELDAGVGGATSASATTASSTISATVGPTTGPTTGTTVSTGGGPVCGFEPADTVSVAIERFNSTKVGCASGPMGNGTTTTTFNGNVIAADTAGHIDLDECSPAADCVGEHTKVTISAKGIAAAQILSGSFVEVRLAVHNDILDGCHATLQLKNLPTWDGAPNPVFGFDGVVLAASSADEAFADAGYTVVRVPLGCYPNQPMGCSLKDDDVYRVTIGSTSTDVAMGSSAEVGSPTWIFTNLQSFTTGNCDDPPHAAYLLDMPKLD